MDQNQTASPQAATDEPASPSSDLARTPRVPRRLRHDGWTLERQVIFLEALSTSAIVADACKAAKMSTASAYAFRGRAAGSAFAVGWEMVLRLRARNGLADEMMSRAMQGYTEEVTDKNGYVIGERHRYDNRLSMAMLTRLDRLAETTGENDQLLRAMSADFDDFLDCIEEGGDAHAFVEARRPAPAPVPASAKPAPEPIASSAPTPPKLAAPAPAPAIEPEIDYDLLASVTGCLGYKTMNPLDIDVSDLPDHLESYDNDQMLRAHYSGYLDYRHFCAVGQAARDAEAERRADEDADRDEPADGDADDAGEHEEPEEIDNSVQAFTRDLRIGRSRFLRRKADAALRARQAEARAEARAAMAADASQPSTSSTSHGPAEGCAA